MKIIYTAFLLSLLFAVNGFSQVKKEQSNTTPKAATIKITLLDLPGVNIEKSKWEVAYELRIITQKELDGAMVNGRLNLDADKKIGEFIVKGSFTKNNLSKKENREVILTVPLDEKIQTKLADELQSIGKSSATAPNNNSSESLSERRMKTQVFVMYANALVYDAKLKKNILVPLDWLLSFARFAHFPGANFQMTFQIKENGEFARSMVLPEKSKNSFTIITKQ